MLAARDQENLVHGHQAAAASKPLNQGTRQMAPKTPGNKAPKTPFKIPLNDENGKGGFGGGKTGLKTNGLSKNAFVTPMGTKSRAPLGNKTTNAKAKLLQTPAAQGDGDAGKTAQNSVSARKPKPKVSHAEMTKLEVLGDKDELEDEEPEIEYMPPRSKNLPDYPDDIPPDINLSMFEGKNMMEGAMGYFATRIGADGLSHVERQRKHQEEVWAKMDKEAEAALQRDMDSLPLSCTHYPECHGELCKDTIEAREEAEKQYKKTMAEINKETIPAWKRIQQQMGPSDIKSKAAASKLSQTKPVAQASRTTQKPSAPGVKPRSNPPVASRPKKVPAPVNPSPMRHTAATAASRTTMGYSKGRAASAELRKFADPQKANKSAAKEIPDQTLAPSVYIARYGEPRMGSEMWIKCKSAGCFDEDSDNLDFLSGGNALDDLIQEDAEQDFQLTI